MGQHQADTAHQGTLLPCNPDFKSLSCNKELGTQKGKGSILQIVFHNSA